MLLTLLAISFATFAAISMRGIQIGTYAVNIKNVVDLFPGYVQLQREGYLKNPKIRLCFTLDTLLKKQIASTPEVESYTPRILADGLISYKDNSLGAIIYGINPQQEKTVTTFMDRIKDGRFFNSDTTYEVVVGYKLLENLKAKIGDEIIMLTQGYDGSLGNLKFKIIGTIKLGSPEFDAMGAFIGLKTAQELLSMPGKIHFVAFKLNNLDAIPEVQEELTKEIDNNELAVLSWEEVMPDYKQLIELDNISGIMFLLILIVIVAFGILNTVLMSVTERFNEFGISLSIGMPQLKLVYLVLIETIFITLLGIALGNVIGWGINYYILLNPIQVGSEIGKIYEEYGFLPVIESSLNITIFIYSSISVLIISLISCLYPVYKVYKLEPLKGIRYT
ncbi:MAG: ABC transporter permease [Ignavibacteria bacterium]|nr:ABC transporter permease [Ignavibacteria bacterium]